MDCLCEMDPCTAETRGTLVSASVTLLEEKYRRSMSFSKYLEQHPDCDNPLVVELIRQTSMYRIALSNVLIEANRTGERLDMLRKFEEAEKVTERVRNAISSDGDSL